MIENDDLAATPISVLENNIFELCEFITYTETFGGSIIRVSGGHTAVYGERISNDAKTSENGKIRRVLERQKRMNI